MACSLVPGLPSLRWKTRVEGAWAKGGLMLGYGVSFIHGKVSPQ